MEKGGPALFFADLDEIGVLFADMVYYQRFEIKGASLIDHWFDP